MAEQTSIYPGHAGADSAASGAVDARPAKAGWGRAFIGLAALGVNSRRSYAIAVLRILGYWVGFQALAYVVVLWLEHHDPRFLPLVLVLVLFLSVIVAGIGTLQSVVRTHRRPWRSLMSPALAVDWRRLAIGAAVQASLALGTLAAFHVFGGWPWPSLSVPDPTVAALCIMLIPFQAASEEILFRGYLTQAFGRLFHNRAKIVVAVGLLFAVVHRNAYGPLTMPYMFIVSLAFSAVTLRDDRLELAIGAHTANNWLGIGTIGALIYRHAAPHIIWPQLAVLAVECALFYGTTRVLVRRFCDPPSAP